MEETNKSNASTQNIVVVGFAAVLIAAIAAVAAYFVINTSSEDNSVDVPSGYTLYETSSIGFAYPDNYKYDQVSLENGGISYALQPMDPNSAEFDTTVKILETTQTIKDEQKDLLKSEDCDELANKYVKTGADTDGEEVNVEGLELSFDDLQSYDAGSSNACSFVARADYLGFKVVEHVYYVFNTDTEVAVLSTISFEDEKTPGNLEELKTIAKSIRAY